MQPELRVLKSPHIPTFIVDIQGDFTFSNRVDCSLVVADLVCETLNAELLSDTLYRLISLESQLPHKTVKLIFELVAVNNQLTIL